MKWVGNATHMRDRKEISLLAMRIYLFALIITTISLNKLIIFSLVSIGYH